MNTAIRFRSQSAGYLAPAPRVLVVTRDQPFRRWAHAQLRDSGFETLVADDGFDASQVVVDDPPELIVVDHALPWFGVMCLICLVSQMSGDTATPLIPVLLVTPRATRSFVEACRALGVAVLVRHSGEPEAVLHLPVRQPHTPPCVVLAGVHDPSYERRF
jgi:CheY-like chemotaxis protein